MRTREEILIDTRAAASRLDHAINMCNKHPLEGPLRGWDAEYKSALREMNRLRAELEAYDAALHAKPNRSRRARYNSSMPAFKVFHTDHGISAEQMQYIQAQLVSRAPQGFFIQEVKLPARLGTVPNALYGPASGDAPVPERLVHYVDRSGRGWTDRMIDLPPRPVNYVQVIGIRAPDSFTLFTVYGGPLAPQNPADPGNQDPAGAQQWWSEHALSSHLW